MRTAIPLAPPAPQVPGDGRVTPSATVRGVMVSVLATLVLAACGSSPVQPPPPPPPPPPNQPPTIQSIQLDQRRVDVGTRVAVSAVVVDAETPVEQLRYQWTATLGLFEGEGREVTWQAPADIDEPVNVTLRVSVIESVPGGSPGQANQTSFELPDAVRVHDSERELRELTRAFLDDFLDDSVSPSRSVRDFSDTCSGKESEREDVERVRELYSMLPSSSYSIRSVVVTEPWARAEMTARCEFVSRHKATGVEGIARGICNLTGIYEGERWWLCTSRLNGTSSLGSSIIR